MPLKLNFTSAHSQKVDEGVSQYSPLQSHSRPSSLSSNNVGPQRSSHYSSSSDSTYSSSSSEQRAKTLSSLRRVELPPTADMISSKGRRYRDYSKNMKLKNDHKNRPMWVCKDGLIFLELFLPVSKQASDFLVNIAEPICRPEMIHEFQITIFSLYGAISVGLSDTELLENLNKFSKNELPEDLVRTIRAHAQAFGKVKLVLRDNKYWVEATDKRELDLLLKNEVIKNARVRTYKPAMSIFSSNNDMDDLHFGTAYTQAPLSSQPQQNSHTLTTHPATTPLIAQTQSTTPQTSHSQLANIQQPPNTAPRTGSQLTNIQQTQSSAPQTSSQLSNLQQTQSSAPQTGSQLSAIQPGSSAESSADGYVTTTVPLLDASPWGLKATEKDESIIIQSDSTDPVKPAKELLATESSLQQVYAFEVVQELIEEVKREALEAMHRPLVMEYDFRKDKRNPNLNCSLKCTTKIRYYQERALRKMFSNGRARSGIIVLPCGAGKTLTGITAACTIRKSVMVLTTSAVAVEQWRKQIEEYTTLGVEYVKPLTSDNKSDLWSEAEAGVLISTYTMLAYSGKRSQAAERIIQQIRNREWGLLIFDEVQYAPAPAFRRINETIRSHCKLGLTATLVREDDLIKDLQWLIGPKLYEANWLELQECGFLARVTCQEVWCPMSRDFFREYIRCSHAKQRKLWVCNPNKMMICEFLIKYHELRGDKIIVFSDNVFALLHAAKSLQRPFIYGKVSPAERMALLAKFKNENNFNTIFLSKVGDNAIDIPCANVVIQISFNFASRRQEAQRLGRILRPKPRSEDNEFNAFFYSLVSKDTHEMLYADKRQQFIIDQGYSYRVLQSSNLPMDDVDLVYRKTEVQQEVLKEILISDDNELDEDEEDANIITSSSPTAQSQSDTQVTQLKRGLASISGGANGQLYFENRHRPASTVFSRFSEPKLKSEKKEQISNMHPLFRRYHSQNK